LPLLTSPATGRVQISNGMGIAVPVRWSLRLVEIVHPTPEKELIVYLQATSADLGMEFHEVTPIVIAFMGAAATVLFAIYSLLKKWICSKSG
jgi:hypothetical protein